MQVKERLQSNRSEAKEFVVWMRRSGIILVVFDFFKTVKKKKKSENLENFAQAIFTSRKKKITGAHSSVWALPAPLAATAQAIRYLSSSHSRELRNVSEHCKAPRQDRMCGR